MQQLHLVGFTADLEGLIFSAKKGARSGAFVVAIDESLLTALEEARKMVSAAAANADGDKPAARGKKLPALGRTGRTSTLSVREIQSRLRAGSSLAEVADAAGVDEGWIARFAAPVLAEQAAVVSRTLPLVFETNRKGASAKALGEAVRWNLGDRGIVIDDSSFDTYWSAFQVTPGQWAVRFTYQSRGRMQMAEWEVDWESGQLTARNRLASDLAYVEHGARRRRPPGDHVEAAPAKRPPAKGSPARPATARGTASGRAKKASAKKATATKAPAKKSAAKRAPAKKAASQKAAPKRSVVKKTGATRAAATRKATATKASAKKAAPASAASPAPVLVIPAPRPGNRGVTAAQAAATPATARHGIGNPGRPNPSPTPYRPTVAAPPRPAPRPAAPAPAPPPRAERPAPEPPEPAPERPPVRIPAPAPVQGQPQRNVVPAVPVPPRSAPAASTSPRPSESSSVRRLPAPSPAAVAMREQVRPPTPSGPAEGSSPSAAEKPSILVIDAEPAGRRRPQR